MDSKLDINTISYLLGVPSKDVESRVNAKLDECGDKLLAANFPRMVREGTLSGNNLYPLSELWDDDAAT